MVYKHFRKPETSPTEKYYFGGPVTIKKYPHGSEGGLSRSYSSVQNIHSAGGGGQHRRPEHYNSTGNIYRTSHVSRRHEPHHLLASRDKRSEHRWAVSTEISPG